MRAIVLFLSIGVALVVTTPSLAHPPDLSPWERFEQVRPGPDHLMHAVQSFLEGEAQRSMTVPDNQLDHVEQLTLEDSRVRVVLSVLPLVTVGTTISPSPRVRGSNAEFERGLEQKVDNLNSLRGQLEQRRRASYRLCSERDRPDDKEPIDIEPDQAAAVSDARPQMTVPLWASPDRPHDQVKEHPDTLGSTDIPPDRQLAHRATRRASSSG